ncbi:MAG: N-6 DNA methylase [Gordonibacter pamelaeae]
MGRAERAASSPTLSTSSTSGTTRASSPAPRRSSPTARSREHRTWAMGKSAMMLRNIASGSGDAFDQMSDLSRYIRQGDTLDNDQFPHEKFNYQLTNPPYGKKWEKEKAGVLDEAALGEGGRFFAGVPFVSDGAMLFMQNVVSKMAPVEEGGGKAAIALSGSPLFNGQAGSGPSSIRRWFFERDVVECIVKLPTNIFFRTGIATYIWIFNNHKDECRRHKIQLIDASECKSPLRKSLGNKRFEVSEEGIDWMTKVYVDGHDHGKSVIVDDKGFMYRAVATKRPMRVEIIPNPEKTDALFSFSKPMAALDDDSRELLREWVQAKADSGSGLTYAEAEADCTKLTRKLDTVNHRGKPGKQKILDALVTVFGVKGEDKALAVTTKGETIYDPDLADIENVPWTGCGRVHVQGGTSLRPGCQVDESVVDSKGNLADGEIGQVGTSISFNRYFYEYEQPRDPNEIAEEILELETSLGDELKELLQP